MNRVGLVFCLIAEKLQTGVLKENYLKGLGLNIRIQKKNICRDKKYPSELEINFFNLF